MDLKLPPLGEGADSGNVVSILVKEGDAIAKGQGIIELETGKAVAPVPASAAGKVTKIIVAVGDKISVGQPILSLDDPGNRPRRQTGPGQTGSRRAPPCRPPPRRRRPPRRKSRNRRQWKRKAPGGRNRPLRLRSAAWRANWALISENSRQ
jgi:pyruvate dehydrogenase E2 component (dihydrolipoamide acetyltransferase)